MELEHYQEDNWLRTSGGRLNINNTNNKDGLREITT